MANFNVLIGLLPKNWTLTVGEFYLYRNIIDMHIHAQNLRAKIIYMCGYYITMQIIFHKYLFFFNILMQLFAQNERENENIFRRDSRYEYRWIQFISILTSILTRESWISSDLERTVLNQWIWCTIWLFGDGFRNWISKYIEKFSVSFSRYFSLEIQLFHFHKHIYKLKKTFFRII